MRVALSPLAAQDIEDIADYIAVENPAAARRLIEAFRVKFADLSENPRIGVARPELLPDIRSVAVGRYIVFYSIGPTLRIERILHGARDIETIFDTD